VKAEFSRHAARAAATALRHNPPMPSVTAPYWRLSSFYFWYYAALGGFTPYFAQWLHDLGQDEGAISALMALWYATRVFAPTSWSALSTRSAHPIRWLQFGAVLTLFGFTGFVFAQQFFALFAVMLFFSFFCNAIMPQFEALTLNTLHGRREEYGRIRVWGSIGFILVTLGYGWLLERHGSAWLPLLMLPLFALTAGAAFVNRMPSGAPHEQEAAPGSVWQALRRPGVPGFLAVALLMQIGFGPYYVFFTLYLGDAGHGTDTIGGLWALGVLAEIVLFVLAPQLLRRHSPRSLVLFSLAATALRWLATAFYPDSLAVMVSVQLLHALSFGVFHACCMQLIAAYFPGRWSAHGQALLYGLSSGVGGVIGAAMAGAAWEFGGGVACFAFGAGAAAIGFVLALRLRVPAPSNDSALGTAAVVDA
jgi:MFS transporter, PPP family, 3-phenylpropionic acid transporter